LLRSARNDRGEGRDDSEEGWGLVFIPKG